MQENINLFMNPVNIIKIERINMAKMLTNNKTEFEKCVVYKKHGDSCEIKCRLGFWSVEGLFNIALIHEANHYFQQYKEDGEYDELLK